MQINVSRSKKKDIIKPLFNLKTKRKIVYSYFQKPVPYTGKDIDNLAVSCPFISLLVKVEYPFWLLE